MKTKLTPEQSQRLIELGVDPSKANEVKEFDDELSLWTHRGNPIFTLTDILALLPKMISLHRDICQIEIKWHGDEWIAKYDDSESDYFHTEHSPELIDALFELLIWCITNKHIEL